MKSKLAIVFGVSQGLGLSLVESYLSLNVNVIGVGRRNSIISDHYQFLECDLSIPQNWSRLLEMIPTGITEIDLIYNAGSLGEVSFIKDSRTNPIGLFQLNIISWMDIVRTFLNSIEKDISINFVCISSGAGRRGVPGWSYYGATKAALDNFMLTLKEEVKLEGRLSKVYSLSPGVMDTAMQKKIRSFSVIQFPQVQNYIEMYEMGELRSSGVVSQELIRFLNLPLQEKVLIGVQDLDL